MKNKYKIGDTVFYQTKNEQGELGTAFGLISRITVEMCQKEGKTQTEIFYHINILRVEESLIEGRAVIQKPRTRKTRARKAIDQMKAMTNGHAEEATA